MNNGELVRQIVVRGREPGYLRLEFPVALCGAAASAAIEATLRELNGLYRTSFYPRERKLAVRYDEHTLDVGTVAARVKQAVLALPDEALSDTAAPQPAVASPPSPFELLRDLGERLLPRVQPYRSAQTEHAAPQAASGGNFAGKMQSLVSGALTEQGVTNFLNDLVAFYLIKVHWDLITQRWIKDPVKYANAWLTTFYLVFLLVRYRKSITKKPPPVAQP